MNLLKNIIILFTLISFFSCAPTTIEKKQPIEKVPEKIEELEITDEKEEVTKSGEYIKKPTKPEDKLIDFNDIEKIIVFLSEDDILTSLFYEVFLREIENFPNIKNVDFIYSIEEIQNQLNNTLIIGPTNSKDLFNLPNKLGENTFIISLSNDYSVMNKYADNEIIFVFTSPYHHIEVLGDYIKSSNSLGVLYKQNEYGLKLFKYFEDSYPLKYIKSTPFGDSAVDLELSVKLMGDLDTYDEIIIIDDSFSYKDLVGYLATEDGTYPLERVYLIDNFLEQRKKILENYYKPIKRTYLKNINIVNMDEPHREFFFKTSVKISLSIANQILKNNFLPSAINHEDFGRLTIENLMISYPIIFE
jgi:hypothetical protein